MEDEDPVIQEIPVFLSQSLSDNLYVYQYPVKPFSRDWSTTHVVNAKVKPKNNIVRLEVELDTYSDTYCVSKGEQIAINTDGQQESRRERKEQPYFRSGLMDKLVYESISPGSDPTNYAVAILQSKEIHCTPIKGIAQLRPTCTYLDQEQRTRDKHDSEDVEESTQQVTVKFGRQETEMAKKAREKSYEFVQKKSLEEPWSDAMYRHDDTDYADLERLKLLSVNPGEGSQVSLERAAYVRALAGRGRERMTEGAGALLRRGGVLSLSEVARALHLSTSAALAAVGAAGVCVRGLWTAPSESLRWSDTRVPGSTMSAARDHVIYLLTRLDTVERESLAGDVRLPPAQLLEVLTSVCVLQGGKWRLMVPPDVAFEKAHPDIMERYRRYWEGRERLFLESVRSHPRLVKSDSDKSVEDEEYKKKKKRNRLVSSSSQESLK